MDLSVPGAMIVIHKLIVWLLMNTVGFHWVAAHIRRKKKSKCNCFCFEGKLQSGLFVSLIPHCLHSSLGFISGCFGGLVWFESSMLGLSLMGPPWLTLNTFEGKIIGSEPWPFNHTNYGSLTFPKVLSTNHNGLIRLNPNTLTPLDAIIISNPQN